MTKNSFDSQKPIPNNVKVYRSTNSVCTWDQAVIAVNCGPDTTTLEVFDPEGNSVALATLDTNGDGKLSSLDENIEYNATSDILTFTMQDANGVQSSLYVQGLQEIIIPPTPTPPTPTPPSPTPDGGPTPPNGTMPEPPSTPSGNTTEVTDLTPLLATLQGITLAAVVVTAGTTAWSISHNRNANPGPGNSNTALHVGLLAASTVATLANAAGFIYYKKIVNPSKPENTTAPIAPEPEVTPPAQTSASNRLQPPSIFFVPFMLLNKGRDLLQLATQKFLAPANTNAEPEVVAESTVVPLNITVTPLSPEQSSDTVSVLAAQFITQAKANGWHVDEEAAAHAFANGEFSYDTQSRSVTFSPETKAALESSLTSSTALFGQGLAKSSALNFVSGFVDGWQFSRPEHKVMAQLAVQTGQIAITALSNASALYLTAGNLVGEGVSRFYSPTIGGLITESVKTISDALLMSGPLPLYAAKVVADVAKPLLQVGGSYAAQYLQGQQQKQDTPEKQIAM